MTGGSLGLRTGSYGSLQQQFQTSVLPNQPSPPVTNRKPSKMLGSNSRDKEKFLHTICKFAGRKKVGMMLLCVISAAVFVWVLYVAKGEDTPESEQIQNIRFNDSIVSSYPESSMISSEQNSTRENKSPPLNIVSRDERRVQPAPSVFLGYTLPSGHPCQNFALPPPPSDRKRTGPRPCPVCYLSVAEAIAVMPKDPSPSPVLNYLTYVYEDNLTRTDSFGGSMFGGYPSLKQRNDSFDIKESMTVHCGFVRGIKPGRDTGFDIAEPDLLEMEQCHGVVVASAIFGNYDIIQQPENISEAAKVNVSFYMFVDEETEEYIRNSTGLGNTKWVGLWRIIVVHHLPYADARRNGKVPKLLLHRIFPNARYSIWIDGKLKLVVDPYQILERFLWRKNASFAISRHYRRFDVFEEANANKAAGKYDNASIDFQVEFYKREGLTPYSKAKLPITSDVPEGCVIIREHIPITNLFTCLWFNEVDRFTSRDQLSFSIVRDKIMSKVKWSVNMFMDCERRNFVVQAYHRDLLEHMAAPISSTTIVSSPAVLAKEPPVKSSPDVSTQRVKPSAEVLTQTTINSPPALFKEPAVKTSPAVSTQRIVRSPIRKRGRERRISRRHRKASAGSRNANSS